MSRDRGQLVLLAAVLLALALVPLTLAYLQLGYHDDIGANSPATTMSDTERAVEQGVSNAATGVRGEFEWTEREQAVDAFQTEIAPTIESVSQARLDAGQSIEIAYNETRANVFAASNCPSGAGQQFGSCEAIDGVVVQERVGTTHILAVAVDIELTGPDEEQETTTVLQPTAGE